jgi:hypothetical protein
LSQNLETGRIETKQKAKPEDRNRSHNFFLRHKPTALAENSVTQTVLTVLTGFLLGYSVSVGLGLDLTATLAFGLLAAAGVWVSGSLISYLVIQTVILASAAVLYKVSFTIIPDFRIEPETFQISFGALILLSPFLGLVRRIKDSLDLLKVSIFVQASGVVMFAALVLFLRSRMPADATHALTRMFEGEDNAGIVEVLAGSLENGFTPQAAQFGEFINALYLFAANTITSFSESDSGGLLSVLTHYNMTLLFMAWVPLAALCALALSGKRFTNGVSIAFVAASTAISALLFWPFVTLGHTSVISSGLFAMSLLALTLNRDLALKHPMFFALLVTSLGFVVGTSWFPMMPFAAATVAFTYFSLLQVEYKKGNVKIVVLLFSVFAGLLLALLPGVMNLVLNSGRYLEMQGGTRSATPGLVALFAVLVALCTRKLVSSFDWNRPVGSQLYLATLAVLFGSNIYLLASGYLENSGSFGYGATKYLLTTISFTLTVIFITGIDSIKSATPKLIATLGVAVAIVILMVQPDSRKVPAAALLPNLTSWQFLNPNTSSEDDSQYSAIASAINLAMREKPDHVFCVSDAEESWSSYFCNRWAGSINLDQGSFFWGAIPIGVNPKDSLNEYKNQLGETSVTILRIANPSESGGATTDTTALWWSEYVSPSWKVIDVK